VTLPAFRSLPGLCAAAVTTVLVCAAMYFIPQHWHFARPVELPLTALDRVIPFWPVSGLVYYGAFLFQLAVFLALPDRERATRYLYAALVAQVIGMTCFLCWPVEYPRELYPLPASAGALGASLVQHVRASDASVNCLPSLHVSSVTLCALAMRGSRWFGAAAMIALACAVSTLTFKQHYAVDVITGAALGAAAWWLCFEWKGLRLR
jgi:membrane-associated phospholipid phosphatase